MVMQYGCQTMIFLLSFTFIALTASSEVKVKRGLPEFAVVGRCPDKWKNSFCTCDINDYTLSVTIKCSGIEDVVQLKNVLDFKWSNSRFDWFVLENSSLPDLPGNSFRNLSFMGFIMTNNDVGEIDDKAFAGSKTSCDYMWLSNIKFKSGKFNFKAISRLKNLVTVSIVSTNLTIIPERAFSSLSNLESILLTNNSIQSLGENAFTDLPLLRRIDLSWNDITKLKNFCFNTSNTHRALSLNLVHNKISEIEKDAFKNLNVYYLNLQYNRLSTLKQEVFEGLLTSMSKRRGSKLFVDGNPFLCDKSIEWLAKKPFEYRQQVHGFPCINQNNLMNVDA